MRLGVTERQFIPIPGLKIREDELSVTFPDTGRYCGWKVQMEPDRLRGIHPRFVVLDEVGQMKRDTWSEVILPFCSA